MTRPCFLVVDREFPGSISTRKLVIETAKLNVITAYSGAEAVETLRRFPALNGVVMDANISDIPCVELTRLLKEAVPRIPVIIMGAYTDDHCPGGDHFLESFEPRKLLSLLEHMQATDSLQDGTRDDSVKIVS